MTKTITIKVTAPEDYDDVCDQSALDDFVGQPKGFGVELLLNVRGECCLCTGEFEDIHIKFDQKKAENETLRAKLEKAEKVMDIASKYSVGWLYAWKNEFYDAYEDYQETEETK